MTKVLIEQRPPGARSSMYYGPMGGGKTHLTATHRRVAWFGSARENGQVTIQYMDPTTFYEAGHPPLLYTVSSIREFWNHINGEVADKIKRREVMTLAVELTCLAEDYIFDMAKEFKENTWGLYQGLANAIRSIDEFGRRVGVQIVYNALAAHTEEAAKVPGGISIPGRVIKNSLPATTDLIGYMREDENGDHILHLRQYGPFVARHRFGKRLPPLIRNPTYRQIEQLLLGKATCDANGVVSLKEESKPAQVTSQPQQKATGLGTLQKLPKKEPQQITKLQPLKK